MQPAGCVKSKKKQWTTSSTAAPKWAGTLLLVTYTTHRMRTRLRFFSEQKNFVARSLAHQHPKIKDHAGLLLNSAMWLFKCEKAYSTPRLYATTFYFVQFSSLQSNQFQPTLVGASWVFGLHFRQYNDFTINQFSLQQAFLSISILCTWYKISLACWVCPYCQYMYEKHIIIIIKQTLQKLYWQN